MSITSCSARIFRVICVSLSAAMLSSCAAVEWLEDAFETSDVEPDTPIVTQPSASDGSRTFTEKQAVQYAASKITFFLSEHGASPCPKVRLKTSSDSFMREVVYELITSNVAVCGDEFVISSEKRGNVVTVSVSGKENYSFRIKLGEEAHP